MLPTFLIAGVAKAGTTSLYNYLNEHPKVDMCSLKEPRFFTDRIELGEHKAPYLFQGGTQTRGLHWYESLYAHAKEDHARGEASSYLHYPEAPELIKQAVPGVRLIFILRHPVDRVFSAYWQDKKMGRAMPDFERAVREEHPCLKHHINMSSYAQHLRRFYNVFSREQILILLFDDLVSDPHWVTAQAYDHVGVDSSFEPETVLHTYNPRSLPRSETLQVVGMRAARKLRRMHLPSSLKGALRKGGRLMLAANMGGKAPPGMAAGTRCALLEKFESDVDFVEHQVGRTLPSWHQ